MDGLYSVCGLTASETRLKIFCGFPKKTFRKTFIEKDATGCIKLYVLVTEAKHGGKTMSTSLAYHTQGIIGFQHQSYEFSGGVAIQRLIRKEFRCPRCFHSAVKTYPIRTRRIQGLPYGTKTTFFASSAVCEKLASNDDFEIVVRQIENLKAHIFKISVSICLSKHCPYLVIETFHGGIGHVPEAPESQNSIPML